VADAEGTPDAAADAAPGATEALVEGLRELLGGWVGDAGVDLAAVFLAAFGAATILPFYSEVLVVSLVLGGRDPWLVGTVATVGNTLGAVVNWWIGARLEHWREHGGGPRWLHPREADVERAKRWYGRFGIWSLLLAWLPVGGDALTFIAGIMRVRLAPFLVLVGLGKALRYAVVVAGAASAL
jgi:membrane protein YqaA with SNARE-associated domain